MSRRFLVLAVLVGGASLAGCASTNEDAKERAQAHEILALNEQLDQMGADTARAVAELEAAKTARTQAEREAQLRAKTAEEAANRAREYQAQNEAMRRDLAAKPATAAPVAIDDSGAIASKAESLRRAHPGLPVAVTTDGNIEITLPSDVTFGSGKSDLSESGKKSVRGLSSLLNGEFAPYMIRVEGHTDATPLRKTADKFTDNFGLGSARALEVVRFMKSEMKIDAARLMSASRGEQQPVAKGDKPADLAKNRRVAIVVVIPGESAAASAK